MEYHSFRGGQVADVLFVCRGAAGIAKKRPEADAFRLRGGPLIAILTLAFCVVLFMQTPLSNLSIVLGVITIAALNWLLVRNSDATERLDA